MNCILNLENTSDNTQRFMLGICNTRTASYLDFCLLISQLFLAQSGIRPETLMNIYMGLQRGHNQGILFMLYGKRELIFVYSFRF